MDRVVNELDAMHERLRRAAPQQDRAPSLRLAEHVEHLVVGRWRPIDVVEMQVDEISTAVSVGSGTAARLGGKPEKPKTTFPKKKDDEDEKSEARHPLVHPLVRKFQEWAQRKDYGQRLGADVIDAFIEEVAPGLPRPLRGRLKEQLRKVGYRLC